MTVDHVISDPRTTQIEHMFSSLVSAQSIVFACLRRLLAQLCWQTLILFVCSRRICLTSSLAVHFTLEHVKDSVFQFHIAF
jgi:hypothetical protein